MNRVNIHALLTISTVSTVPPLSFARLFASLRERAETFLHPLKVLSKLSLLSDNITISCKMSNEPLRDPSYQMCVCVCAISPTFFRSNIAMSKFARRAPCLPFSSVSRRIKTLVKASNLVTDRRNDTAVMHTLPPPLFARVRGEREGGGGARRAREFGAVIAAYSEIPLSRQQLVSLAMTTIDDDGVSHASRRIIEAVVSLKQGRASKEKRRRVIASHYRARSLDICSARAREKLFPRIIVDATCHFRRIERQFAATVELARSNE